MKFFADLHLCPNLERHSQIREIIEKSAGLGYDAVGIVFTTESTQRKVQEVRGIGDNLGVDLVVRIDLTPKSSRDLLMNLRNLRGKTEILAVRCYSKGVARQAAKDRRVDILSFPSTNPRKRFFDSAEAELASEASACLEVDMAPLLYLHGFRRSRLLSFLRRETLIAQKFGVPIVLSSGANDPRLLRKPEDYASLSYIFGMNYSGARKALSDIPQIMVERNRRKLSDSHVAPGVYVIRRGKDCESV